MIEETVYSLFKNGSKTYFYSSLFFPKYIRYNVFVLYGFVRKADDFVDAVPQDKEGFYRFTNEYRETLRTGDADDIVIDLFVQMMRNKGIREEWVNAFLYSMRKDLNKSTYKTLGETKEYIYGSAEVIGLMMSTIMGLPKRAYSQARLLGRAMQYINFIRDIDEDIELGRIYLPEDEMIKYNLKSLREDYTRKHPDDFKRFMRAQIRRYAKWQKEAEKGYIYIPRLFLIPIKTASDMYNWTAREIMRDPFTVYNKKIKPSIAYIITTIIKNTVNSL
ncbi:MAG: phytoene/squalene synthase family protein [bacterium]